MAGSNRVSSSIIILIPVTQYTVRKGRALWCLEASSFPFMHSMSRGAARLHPALQEPPG